MLVASISPELALFAVRVYLYYELRKKNNNRAISFGKDHDEEVQGLPRIKDRGARLLTMTRNTESNHSGEGLSDPVRMRVEMAKQKEGRMDG